MVMEHNQPKSRIKGALFYTSFTEMKVAIRQSNEKKLLILGLLTAFVYFLLYVNFICTPPPIYSLIVVFRIIVYIQQ
jgi:hypothetical protein